MATVDIVITVDKTQEEIDFLVDYLKKAQDVENVTVKPWVTIEDRD
jgi:hypothetical protein